MADVTIKWTRMGLLSDLWDASFCLYAYLHPRAPELLYIGKADTTSVLQRLRARDKRDLYEFLREERRLTDVSVLHGDILLPEGQRRSSALLEDLESLLIKRLQPVGNIKNTKNRSNSRRGLTVECVGDWPIAKGRFRDAG